MFQCGPYSILFGQFDSCWMTKPCREMFRVGQENVQFNQAKQLLHCSFSQTERLVFLWMLISMMTQLSWSFSQALRPLHTGCIMKITSSLHRRLECVTETLKNKFTKKVLTGHSEEGKNGLIFMNLQDCVLMMLSKKKKWKFCVHPLPQSRNREGEFHLPIEEFYVYFSMWLRQVEALLNVCHMLPVRSLFFWLVSWACQPVFLTVLL